MNEALDRACEAVGGPTKLAALIGVSKQSVTNWRTRGVPAEHVPDIERATGGAVRAEEILPTVNWGVLRQKT